MVRLQRCLASITGNDYPRELIEIIVVDNDSTDGSAAVAKASGAVVIKSPSGTVAALRNRGARAALGSLIAFADSDHEISRHWIATAVEVLSDPWVAATGAQCHTSPTPNWVQEQYDGLRSRATQREDTSWLGSGNLAVKRSVFEHIGGFDTSLVTCEDVDLCNRMTSAGFRIVADPGLGSIHFGDPSTLKALFFGELWRGRDNLRVTFAGPRTFRHLRSALIPIGQLTCLVAAVGFAGTGYWIPAALSLGAALAPAAVRAAQIRKRRLRRGPVASAQALAVAVVFDLARAFAIIAGGSHRARRAA
jgi:GT2 family glycosyltransferase